jgi:hypothetical protein
MSALIFTSLFCHFFYLSLATRNEIKGLPGWDGILSYFLSFRLCFSFLDKLPSRMYSGMIYAGQSNNIPSGDMFMHYWFVESEGNPLKVFYDLGSIILIL